MSDSPEMVGAADYDADRTLTCDGCGETTDATEWDQTGPTYSSENIQIATMARCPVCGALQ